MKYHKQLLISFTVLFIVALVWDYCLYRLSNHTTLWNYGYNLLMAVIMAYGGVVAIWYGIKFGLKSTLGKMLLFFGVSLACFAAGNFIWGYYNFVLKVAVPFPSWADLAYSCQYPCLILGAFFLVKIYQPLINKKLLVISILTSIITFIVIFKFFSKPDLSANLPLLQKIISIYNPVSDAVAIIIALIALQIGGGKFHYGIYIVVVGLFAFGTADLLYSYRTSLGLYWNGDISDFCFTCYAYITGLGLMEIVNTMKQPIQASTLKLREQKVFK